MISSGINLVMAVVGFSLSIMFITFVCVRLICARMYMRSSAARAFGSDLTTMERGFRGLEPQTLASFPTKKYRELCLSSNENAQCTVCLSSYHNDDTLRILPACGHSFHARCIDIWLHQHFTCPVCRVSLRNLPKRRWFSQPLFASSRSSSQRNAQPPDALICHCSTPHDGERTESRSCSEGNGNSQHAVKNSTGREVASPSGQ
ncbi:RING-H2 finger protein ATL39-like [Andrographis paniculata]|uniref:RING-H2 finger protein ATL39-like n=1 Tax=Andrographis paniculata TaxID=175694 RepID=UPI0021E7FE68|nr:RING-H2 finger protein ATL39-like [Andrographis paniculata]